MKALQRPPRVRRGGRVFTRRERSGILDRLERAVERDVRRRLVVDDVQVVLELLALLPLPADQRRRAHVRHRIGRAAALPGDRADQRLVVGVLDGVADRGRRRASWRA